jgi:hypothetical protein
MNRRRQLAGVLALGAVAVVCAVLLSGGPKAGRPAHAVLPSSSTKAPGAGRTRIPARVHRQQASARLAHASSAQGSLAQTSAFPSSHSATFKELMASLWSGIEQNSIGTALPAFFPRGAYVQLKAIPSAGSDWSGRLVHDYALDIAAAHALLGSGAAHAQLVSVSAPSGYGHWVRPGVCYNDVGYYELPNARVVYRKNGELRSFGIASMISWRGVWYVVHLGAILRQADVGVVDEPSSGAGSSAYSGTC